MNRDSYGEEATENRDWRKKIVGREEYGWQVEINMVKMIEQWKKGREI